MTPPYLYDATDKIEVGSCVVIYEQATWVSNCGGIDHFETGNHVLKCPDENRNVLGKIEVPE